MPTTYTIQFSNVGLKPVQEPDLARTDAVKLANSVSYLKGTILGEQFGNNEFQRLAITGVPTGGTFTLTYAAVATAAIAYNATADAVRVALEAHASFGVGTVKVTGGPLPNYPIQIEFIGALGGKNVTALTTTDSLTGGTSPASAIVTLLDGSAGSPGTYKQVSKTLVAAPTVAPTLGAAGADGSLTTNGVYKVAYTYANPSGETSLSPVASVTAAATNHIAVTTVVPPAGCWVNWYITDANGADLRWYSVSTGALANILAEPTYGTRQPPVDNRCYATVDGSQVAKKFLEFDAYTDSSGNITLGQVNTGNEWAATEPSVPAYYCGFFSTADLVGWNDSMLADLGASYVSGSLSGGGVIKF